MKKWITLTALVLFTTLNAFSQRFGYVDTEAILEQIPDYAEAQSQLDRLTKQWQDEVQRRYDQIDQLYRAYQAEEVILKGDTKIQREQEIIDKERELKEYQKSKFGPGGDLFKKKEELVKPIQDVVYEAVVKVSDRMGLDFIFDKSNGVAMLYANPQYDRSADVLRELGIRTNE